MNPNKPAIALALIEAWRGREYKAHAQAIAALQVLIIQAIELSAAGDLSSESEKTIFWSQLNNEH
jgi:hypothetical protein